MRFFLFLSGLLGIMCSCSAPKLAINGKITCAIYDDCGLIEFEYPNDTKSRQVLNEWLNYYNNQIYWLTLADAQAPAIVLEFPDRTHVYLYDHSSCIYVSPFSIRQYRRKRGDKDNEFMYYLRQISTKFVTAQIRKSH